MGNVDLLCGLGSFEDLETGSLSVQVCLHLLSQHLKCKKLTFDRGFDGGKVFNLASIINAKLTVSWLQVYI